MENRWKCSNNSVRVETASPALSRERSVLCARPLFDTLCRQCRVVGENGGWPSSLPRRRKQLPLPAWHGRRSPGRKPSSTDSLRSSCDVTRRRLVASPSIAPDQAHRGRPDKNPLANHLIASDSQRPDNSTPPPHSVTVIPYFYNYYSFITPKGSAAYIREKRLHSVTVNIC